MYYVEDTHHVSEGLLGMRDNEGENSDYLYPYPQQQPLWSEVPVFHRSSQTLMHRKSAQVTK